MNRYARDYDRSRSASRGGQHGRYGAEFGGGERQRGGRSYDRSYGPGGGGRPNDRQNRYRSERGAAPWYPNPDWSLAENYGDFSGRGRFGGYWGATDLRPMMAGYDAEMRRIPRRNR